MSDFDLDLRAVEEELDEQDTDANVVLGVLDGTTAPEDWFRVVEDGDVLVLAVDGNVNELAAGFARDIVEVGGELIQFHDFLVVTPSNIGLNTERL